MRNVSIARRASILILKCAILHPACSASGLSVVPLRRRNCNTRSSGRRVEIPAWARPIRHDMLDANITITTLASEIGYSRPYIADVMNGTRISPEAQETLR